MTSPKISPLVYVRYLDHVLFKDVDPAAFSEPFTRETIGWLAEENDQAIQLIWERQLGEGPTRQRATGLVILKSDILGIKYIGKGDISQHNAYTTEKEEKRHVAHISRNPATPEGVRQEVGDLRHGDKPGPGRGGEA
ncbi:MAG: hypothetical protein ABH852_02130 [Methanobacteriota archaeon]